MVAREDFFETGCGSWWAEISMRPGGHLWPAGRYAGVSTACQAGWSRHAPCTGRSAMPPGHRFRRELCPLLARAENAAFARRRFLFAQRQGRPRPIIAGKDYNDWEKRLPNGKCIASPRFLQGVCLRKKIKANPVKIIFSLSGTDGCLFIRRSHFCKKNRKINFSTKRRRSVSLCAFPFPAAFLAVSDRRSAPPNNQY